MSMKEYLAKRNFDRSPEPRGAKVEPDASGRSRFVIQMHAASTLHFDFRLEIGGVLKSWAVPKGPSTDPRDKRLAIPTEDHPLEYAAFEGVIPQGEYGGGAVMIWDRGTFRNLTEKDGARLDGETAWANGHLRIELNGEKLAGGYVLHRTGPRPGANWLLIKTRDDHADARQNPVLSKPNSVESGRTIDEIARKP